jgi:aspartate 4-decarboxylase
MPADEPAVGPMSTFELQSAIAAAALDSGKPVLNAGRGQPNWLSTVPRDGTFLLGRFAVTEALAATTHPAWGMTPDVGGIADRLLAHLADEDAEGATFLGAAVDFGVSVLGFDRDAWVHELCRGVLGDGYPSPNRMLPLMEQVMERYTTEVNGIAPCPPGTYQVFATEGGAAAMAYIFRSLQENHVIGHGDKVAIATPVFTPYLQIPTLEDFGLDVVELQATDGDDRTGDGFFDPLLDPDIKVFFVINPGNPDSRAIPPDRIHQLHDLVADQRPDLLIVADTVYATFVPGFRGMLADMPQNVICVHSLSKNFGATGSRLGFIAMHADHAIDRLLASHDEAKQRSHALRYSSMTSDVTSLRYMARLVADSREVALHNIAGLATPDQVQMALFALSYLMPEGRNFIDAVHVQLAAREAALLEPLGLRPPGGQESMYYALIDLRAAMLLGHGLEAAAHMVDSLAPTEIALRLASRHGIVVLPGELFDADSWDVRVSLASLTVDELATVGEAIAAELASIAAV